MSVKIPEILRPRGRQNRTLSLGIDLPSWFYYNLKSIDNHIHIVWHPYRTMWDNIINEYEGPLEDPRFTIHKEAGEEVWGFILTDKDKTPIPDCSFHIWRLCDPHGWAHIVKIESREEEYLNLLLRRLHLQAYYKDTYGNQAWNAKLQEEEKEARDLALKYKQNIFDAVQNENSWLMKKAMENFDRGIYKPTRPEVDQIISFPGQSNRSKTIRPMRDEDAGLVGFDEE